MEGQGRSKARRITAVTEMYAAGRFWTVCGVAPCFSGRREEMKGWRRSRGGRGDRAGTKTRLFDLRRGCRKENGTGAHTEFWVAWASCAIGQNREFVSRGVGAGFVHTCGWI